MSSSYSFGGGDGDDDDNDNLDEEDEADDQEETRWMNKDSLLFLVDCAEAMLMPATAGAQPPLTCALRGAATVYQNKIIAGGDDLVGVVFYNSKNMKNDHNFEGVYVAQQLGVPDAPSVRLLTDLEDLDTLKKTVGHAAKPVSLANVLWNCSMLFSKSAVKVGHKRIFLFTNEDHPYATDRDAAQQAKNKAKDLKDLGIEIELLSMNKPGQKFDLSPFYKEIIAIDDDEDVDRYPAGADKLDQIMEQVRKKEFKKRTLARLPFFLNEKTEISVRIFNLIAEARKGAFSYMDARSQNAEVKPLTKYLTEETGFVVSAKELQSYYEFGGVRVIFSREEVAELKSAGKPGLTLLGFKDRKAIRRKHFLRPGPFMYPNEGETKGSSVVFNALIDSLHRKEKVAICLFVRNSMSNARFVALIPQREQISKDNVQITPPGFNVIYVAFQDDVRKLRKEPLQKATDDEIKMARAIIEPLKIRSWAPEEFRNPALQKHYNNLQAIALNKDADDVIDETVPQVEQMKKRAHKEIVAFKAAVFPPDYVSEIKAAPKARAAPKRKAAADDDDGDGGSSSRKKEKADLSTDDVRNMYNSNKIEKLTIADLKTFLTSVGVRTKATDKKGDLVEKAKDYLAKN